MPGEVEGVEALARELHQEICGCAAAPDDWCDASWLVAADKAAKLIRSQERQFVLDEVEKRFVDGDLPERIEAAVRADEGQRVREALEKILDEFGTQAGAYNLVALIATLDSLEDDDAPPKTPEPPFHASRRIREETERSLGAKFSDAHAEAIDNALGKAIAEHMYGTPEEQDRCPDCQVDRIGTNRACETCQDFCETAIVEDEAIAAPDSNNREEAGER